jgi:hypothetical protein
MAAPAEGRAGWCGGAQAEEDAMRSVRVLVVVAAVATAASVLAATASASKRQKAVFNVTSPKAMAMK